MSNHKFLGGNTTCDLILPKLPSTFSQLIGVDINKNMVDYATKTYPIPKVSFKLLDIGAGINEFKHRHGSFDHIISLFCLHLVPDQKLALQNVYDLLGTNGDCFLHFMCDYDGFDVYRKTYTKWSEYMLDIDEFVSPYHGKISPVNMITKLIKGTGFTTYTVEERRKCIVYHDVQSFLGKIIFMSQSNNLLKRRTFLFKEHSYRSFLSSAAYLWTDRQNIWMIMLSLQWKLSQIQEWKFKIVKLDKILTSTFHTRLF